MLPHLHEREPEQVVTWPGARIERFGIVGPEPDSPEAILRTRFHQNGGVCAQQKIQEARRLFELEQIALYHDVEPRRDPALKLEAVVRAMEGKPARKVIVVPQRIVNVVV